MRVLQNAQAVCGPNYEILWLSVLTVGSTHDSTAWQVSRLGEALKDPTHPFSRSGYWIAGDAAYSGPARASHSNLLTPFPAGCNRYEDNFNYFQSRCRIDIECLFGQLCARFGILWRRMDCSLVHSGEILLACARLHNVCLNQREPIRACRAERRARKAGKGRASRTPQDIPEDDGYFGDVPETTGHGRLPEDRQDRAPKHAQTRRKELVALLKAENKKRPRHSKYTYRSDAQSVASRARGLLA